jgi:hypothetical protein
MGRFSHLWASFTQLWAVFAHNSVRLELEVLPSLFKHEKFKVSCQLKKNGVC